jgi:hypothetical protein
MRTQPDQIEMRCIRLAINQNEIGFDMTIAEIFLLTGQRVIEIAPRQWRIGDERIDDGSEIAVERFAVAA